jgi:hypothetical protein
MGLGSENCTMAVIMGDLPDVNADIVGSISRMCTPQPEIKSMDRIGAPS